MGEAIQADIENGPWPLPGRRFDGVVVTNYLWRPLLPTIVESVAPGGVLLYEGGPRGPSSCCAPVNFCTPARVCGWWPTKTASSTTPRASCSALPPCANPP
jgi:hypothetical protein